MELASSSSVSAPSSSSSSNDIPAPKMAETSNAADSTTLWPAPLVKEFIVILVDETSKGNVCSGIIKRGHGQAVTEEFNNQTGKHYSVQQIKRKLKWLRTKYNLFSQLIGMPGMGWDPNTNTVTGSDKAWLNATKSNSNYNNFRNKGPHYWLLRLLFLTVAQTSSAQHSADDVDEQGSNPKGKQPAHTGTSSRKKRKTVSIAPESQKTVGSAPVHDYSMARATKILISMSGVDIGTKFKALEELRDLVWRQAFIAMDQDTRWEWIKLLQLGIVYPRD